MNPYGWEYDLLDPGHRDWAAILTRLNNLGAAGWEVVCDVLINDEMAQVTGGQRRGYLMKRPIGWVDKVKSQQGPLGEPAAKPATTATGLLAVAVERKNPKAATAEPADPKAVAELAAKFNKSKG